MLCAATLVAGIGRMLRELQVLSSMSYGVCVYANGTSFALELAFLPLYRRLTVKPTLKLAG
jgi:hypothetical protein